MTDMLFLGLMPLFSKAATHLLYKAGSVQGTKDGRRHTMSATLEITPAGPAHAVVASFPSHSGILRPDADQL